jgi:hypothetical protein
MAQLMTLSESVRVEVTQEIKQAAKDTFRKQPLFFIETQEEERERVEALRQEDAIALHDVINTSKALVEAVRHNDIAELRNVVDGAEVGEFLQVFVLQAMVVALKETMFDIVKQMVEWGLDLGHDQLHQSLHLVCEVTTPENFSNAWRIIQALVVGSSKGSIHIDTPRTHDGFTPLCVACDLACIPLVYKLLELGADPNVITRDSETPIAISRRSRPNENEEQQHDRKIVVEMLRKEGGKDKWQDALKTQHKRSRNSKAVHPPNLIVEAMKGNASAGYPKAESTGMVSITTEHFSDKSPQVSITTEQISKTHSRFCG